MHLTFIPVGGVSYETCRFPNPDGTTAVCGLWTPVERLAAEHPDAYMVGPCYSTAGVDMIVRTLLVNPQIHELHVVGPDLSGTQAGIKVSLVCPEASVCLRTDVQKTRPLVGEAEWTRINGGSLSNPFNNTHYALRERASVILPLNGFCAIAREVRLLT